VVAELTAGWALREWILKTEVEALREKNEELTAKLQREIEKHTLGAAALGKQAKKTIAMEKEKAAARVRLLESELQEERAARIRKDLQWDTQRRELTRLRENDARLSTMLVEKDLEIQRLHKPAGDKTHEDKMDDHQSVMPKMMEQLHGMQQSQNEVKSFKSEVKDLFGELMDEIKSGY